jgi:hypothetical protein
VAVGIEEARQDPRASQENCPGPQQNRVDDHGGRNVSRLQNGLRKVQGFILFKREKYQGDGSHKAATSIHASV